jgi:glycosyltransferase involved in cell wall biosynthesis
MDILVAHNFYKQPGGEDQCVAAEVAMLKAHGHNVIEYRRHNDSTDALGRLGLASQTIWNRSVFHELRRLFRIHRPQIVHFHNTFPLISPAAYYAARAENIRVVQTVHNYRFLCANANLIRDGRVCEDCVGKSIGWPGIVHKCYRDSFGATSAATAMLGVHRAIGTWRRVVDVYIALTEFARSKLIEGGLPARKIVIKPNFTHPDPGPGNGSGSYGLFVGRLSAEKGIDTLIEAWRNLNDGVPLKIVGDGPMAAVVEAAKATLPALQWLGRLPNEAVCRLMGEAAFLVLPSRCYETFGRVIIEAYAKGTPVIASKLGAMAELVDAGRTGLHFRPGDPIDLAEKVRQLLANPLELRRMRRAARQEYTQHFNAEANYKALMTIYREAAGGF